MIPSPEQEFGPIEARELKRLANRGAMKPLLCRGNDGRHYIFKPFSRGQTWPLALEWICARLGRALRLPIPNYRQILVSEDLAAEWNAFNERQIEPGVGFGSQQVASAMEFEIALRDSVPEDLRRRVLAFDWWIRNHDRSERNPNLLWSPETRSLHVIDHDQAGQTSDASVFWGTHVFKAQAPSTLVWFPTELAAEFERVRAGLLPSPVEHELPSTWTVGLDGLAWFARQLQRSLTEPPHRNWRDHD